MNNDVFFSMFLFKGVLRLDTFNRLRSGNRRFRALTYYLDTKLFRCSERLSIFADTYIHKAKHTSLSIGFLVLIPGKRVRIWSVGEDN
jgi:hypothetical protein